MLYRPKRPHKPAPELNRKQIFSHPKRHLKNNLL
ncbi:MAG: hypothetical protein ACI82Z_001842, partial [Cellvibrionaceae bacterium]